MSKQPNWYYDEFRQIGVDFENADQVAAYDQRQGSDSIKEKELIQRLGISPDAIVVDMGCGTGSFSLAAAKHGATVHAVDVSKTMLEFVRKRGEADTVSNLETHHAGFLSFSIPDESVDFIVSRYALHHLPDFWKQIALLRLRNMLRKGGLLYLRDVVFSFSADTYGSSIEKWIQRMPEESGFSREEFETHVRDEQSTFHWIMEGMITKAGFQIEEAIYIDTEYAEYVCRV